jgi:hypothetical protein
VSMVEKMEKIQRYNQTREVGMRKWCVPGEVVTLERSRKASWEVEVALG